MKLFNFVDDAYYINLDHREDKKILIEEHFKDMGILDFVKRKKAYAPADLGYTLMENGKYDGLSYGRCCLYSHVDIIKDAKNRNLDNVLIFEDDALFYTEGEYSPIEVVQEAINSLSKIENWEIFYLGTNPGHKLTKFEYVDKNLVRAIEAIGTHAVLISSRIFDKIIADYQHQNVFDLYLSNTYKEKYLAYPMSVIQRCGVLNDIDSTGGGNYLGLNADWWLSMYDKKIV